MKPSVAKSGYRERKNIDHMKEELRLDTALAKSTLDNVAKCASMAFVNTGIQGWIRSIPAQL